MSTCTMFQTEQNDWFHHSGDNCLLAVVILGILSHVIGKNPASMELGMVPFSWYQSFKDLVLVIHVQTYVQIKLGDSIHFSNKEVPVLLVGWEEYSFFHFYSSVNTVMHVNVWEGRMHCGKEELFPVNPVVPEISSCKTSI